MTALAADSGPRESGHAWSLAAVARRLRREAATTALRAAFSETNRLCRRGVHSPIGTIACCGTSVSRRPYSIGTAPRRVGGERSQVKSANGCSVSSAKSWTTFSRHAGVQRAATSGRP